MKIWTHQIEAQKIRISQIQDNYQKIENRSLCMEVLISMAWLLWHQQLETFKLLFMLKWTRIKDSSKNYEKNYLVVDWTFCLNLTIKFFRWGEHPLMSKKRKSFLCVLLQKLPWKWTTKISWKNKLYKFKKNSESSIEENFWIRFYTCIW